MGAEQGEAKEISRILDDAVVAHKAEIVKHILATDEPGKEDW